MDQVLGGLDHATCYLDDILIASSNQEKHETIPEEVLQRLERHNIRVNTSKYSFMEASVEYLGQKVDPDGLHPTKEKITSILESKKPNNVDEHHMFLGLVNYNGKFMPNLSTKLAPVYFLLGKNVQWKWTSECEKPFKTVRNV